VKTLRLDDVERIPVGSRDVLARVEALAGNEDRAELELLSG
jgi:hypothetical protein